VLLLAGCIVGEIELCVLLLIVYVRWDCTGVTHCWCGFRAGRTQDRPRSAGWWCTPQWLDQHACKSQKPMIFDKRRPSYQKAISRLSMKRLHKLLLMAQRLDLAVKGVSAVPLWPGLRIS